MGRYLNKRKELDQIRKEKYAQYIEKEQELMKNFRCKKVAKDVIAKVVDRLYNEAERRRLVKEEKIQQIEKHKEDIEETPSKYINRRIPKYRIAVRLILFSLIQRMRL
jgi:hypothetical protein